MWFCIFLLLGQFFCGQAQTIELRIERGKILGRTGLTEGLQMKYYAFQGIPYAEPPKRFELAILKKRWSGVLNCTADKAECVQSSVNTVGSEDCLFLGVYTRKLTGKSPVLLWIHGGGFDSMDGSYKANGPDYFLDEDLVVVSIQYRLGIFGFMSTGDLACPGNLGLKDQNLALKWVQRNVRYFGGDPDNVSIMGQSAGAAAVAMHLNSPKSKGLFKKAIMHSGVSISSFSLNRRARRTAFAVGATLGIFTKNSTILVNELKKINYQRLQDNSNFVSNGMALDNILAGLPYGPVKEVGHDSAFFTGESEEMLSTGNFTKVPVLAGFTSNETATLFSIALPFRLYFLKFDSNCTDLVPADLTTSSSNRTLAARAIKEKYFGKYLNTGYFAPFSEHIKFFNVDFFVRSTDKFIIDVSKYVNDVYYFMFSYVGDMTRIGRKSEGASHEEDLSYLFKKNFVYSQNDQLMRKRAVRMWSNFCKFSKPIPKADPLLQNATWLPASSKQPPFLMNIDSTLERVNNPYQEYLDFYTKLYKNYGDGLYGTY